MPIINYLEAPGDWKPGIYNLNSYEHYASIPALRSSELKRLGKTPAHYKAAIEFPSDISPQLQKSFDKGKAFDVLILDGEEAFNRLVVVEPDLNRATKAYKQWRAGQPDECVFLSQQEKDFILMMREQAMQKTCFSSVFGGDGYPHRAIVWQDKETGIWCKAEIDWICQDGTVVDLKTAGDAGFWFFQRQARRLNYPNQGAFYLDGLTAITGQVHHSFMLAVVETVPPFESHVFDVGSDMLIRAQAENQRRMEILARCLKNDDWPGYPDQIIDLDSGQYLEDDFYDLDDLMEVNTYGF